MHVSAAGNTSPVTQVATAAKAAPAPAPQPAAKKDTLILSEKAKDLAAMKAGKAAAEEATESITAKQKEGDAD